jgi:NAD(P)H-quinone oxidoreductase subunit 5
MTAPASALMLDLLMVRVYCYPVFNSAICSNSLIILLIIGLNSCYCTVYKLLQVNVKQKLALTIAQMGFMIMQCGLGFFNAAVVQFFTDFTKLICFVSWRRNRTF